MSTRRTHPEARIRQMIARYPRCSKCHAPMCCGQKDTHLSCRPRDDQQLEEPKL
jgi:hypothetical protein